jgi:uncharacterized RDD family membrane protein YckC
MLCPSCGVDVGDKISYCPDCTAKKEAERRAQEQQAQGTSENLDDRSHGEQGSQAVDENVAGPEDERVAASDVAPAGFWVRLFAFEADALVLMLISYGFDKIGLPSSLIGTLLFFIYMICFTASAARGTPGKRLFGLYVLDDSFNRISSTQAVIRELGRIVSSALLLIGYLIVPFSDRKRALHDMMAGTYVVKEIAFPAALRLLMGVAVTFMFLAAGYITSPDVTLPRWQETEEVVQPAPSTAPATATLPSAELPALAESDTGYLKIGSSVVVFKGVIPLLDPIDEILHFGFYRQTIDDTDRKYIRSKNSLYAIPDKQPQMVLTFNFNRDAQICSLAELKHYSITIHRAGPLVFPGDSDSIEILRTERTWVGSNEITSFKCTLRDNDPISGIFNDNTTYDFPDSPLRVIWYLTANSNIVRTDQETALALEYERKRTAVEDLDYSKPGELRIGDSSVAFKTSVPIFYKQHSRIELAFYPMVLSPDEIAAIQKQLRPRAIAGKYPGALISLKFKEGTTTASRDAVESMTLYVYRDPMGKLQFPGQHDALSISRDHKLKLKHEILELRGNLAPGGDLTAAVEGQERLEPRRIPADWQLRYKGTL